ncbi:glycosyltransferase family 15 protein [Seminavis robusta]|uniref:Glycosyltransferase family 15 protein n=1 Tax=Seminavis robusta TaxID=568900 RepID=A0A9N8DIA6_9STRA|nr:glycosyltransferase family 15 protein [Seminavis robusta]|eukprot:Sro101_g051560.1 glycosyltransferase family 15 protein (523) ;mRNA; f:45009-46577
MVAVNTTTSAKRQPATSSNGDSSSSSSKRTKLTRIGAGMAGFLGLYALLNFCLFPKQRKLVVPSGVHLLNATTLLDVDHHQNNGDDDDVCFAYDGILLISYADEDGFATVFFLYILNQLLYAEKHNLLPWIHLDSQTSIHVYDEQEHGGEAVMQVTVLNGLEWDNYTDPHNGQTYEYPGTPILNYKHPKSTSTDVTIEGTGIWNSYFDLPSRLHPLRHLLHPSTSSSSSSSSSCHIKPIFQLSLKQIEPSLMVFCPYCVRAWRRKSTPPVLAQWSLPYQQWFDPMRRRAHGIIRRHYRPTEQMTRLAHQANPVVTAQEDACLALHIRHSDKADRRMPIALSEFRPYVEEYINAAVFVGTTIAVYVATDSNQVLRDIQTEWPVTLSSYVRFQNHVLRSDNTTAVFAMHNVQHHNTNTEVLVDILAMAECEFMVHGMSAVTEAVHYLNLKLHNQSVNLEEEEMTMARSNKYIHKRKPTMTPNEFGTMVRKRLYEKRKAAKAQNEDASVKQGGEQQDDNGEAQQP